MGMSTPWYMSNAMIGCTRAKTVAQTFIGIANRLNEGFLAMK